MAFKPVNAGKSNQPRKEFDDTRNFPVPKAGSRKARVSLIVDLGIQERKDYEDPETGEVTPQKPQQQVVVFADLVNDVVDYGGKIGEAQYRLMLNKSFQGEIEGINFAPVPPRDAKGNLIDGKKWGLHPANLLTKLAKAVGREDVIIDDGEFGMDISQLLNLPFMATVEVKETVGKKKDANGKDIIYKNVNYKAASPMPMDEDEDGNEIPAKVAPLRQPARCITFDDATVEDIQFIRANILAKIKTATNYAKSNIRKAIEEYEAQQEANGEGAEDAGEQETTAKKPAAKKAATKKPPVDMSDLDDDIPF